jgi:4-hydroxy-tetrahydrodipicolinate synthase
MSKDFRGSIVAIVTPLRNDMVDVKTLKKLVEFQIENGTNGIVPCGTTGESCTLDYEEQKSHRICIEAAKGGVPVMAGTGSNSTREAVEMTRRAAKAGADASLQVSPYYNITRRLYLHFKAVAEYVDILVPLYRTHSREYTSGTIANLPRLQNIVEVKKFAVWIRWHK